MPRTIEAVRPGGSLAAEVGGGGESEIRPRVHPVCSHLRSVRPRIKSGPAEEVRRRRADLAREPGHPPEEPSGDLGDVPLPVAARRGPAGPAEVRRGRVASRTRLSGDEKAG